MKPPFLVKGKIKLDDFDPNYTEGLDKETAKTLTRKRTERIAELQELLYANANHALVVLFQGMDASGKDGSTKRLLEFVDPIGVEIANFKTPSSEEKAHDFLWRVHRAVPRYGSIGVFNRSHYEDVLIVRVLNLQPKSVWEKRYDQINAFERILTENEVILLKFFLHISKEEQAERLRARLENPKKKWKFAVDDLEMRKRWNDFERAYEDAISRCSTSWAPWHIVPADNKWYRDYLISGVVVEALEKLKMSWPKPRLDPSKIVIK